MGIFQHTARPSPAVSLSRVLPLVMLGYASPFLTACQLLNPTATGNSATSMLHADTGSGFGGFSPAAAVDDAGYGLAAWIARDATGLALLASWYVPGTGWQRPFIVSSQDAMASDVQLAMDRRGHAIVVWVEARHGIGAVFATRCDVDVGCTPVTQISGRGAAEPALAMEPSSGGAMVVWKERDSPQTRLWALRYSPDHGWGDKEVVATMSGPAVNPRLAISGAGEAAVVWSQWDDDRYRVVAASAGPDHGWEPATALDLGVGDALHAQVALSVDGRAVVVWRQFEGSDFRVYARDRDSTGTWNPPMAVERQHDDSVYPQVAMNRLGEAVAAWVQRRCLAHHCDYSYVWLSRLDRRLGWSAPTRMSSRGWDVQVTLDHDGTAYAVWAERRGLLGTRSAIVLSRDSRETGWRRTGVLNIGGESGHPAMATANGHTVLVWERFLGDRRQVWGTGFDAPAQ